MNKQLKRLGLVWLVAALVGCGTAGGPQLTPIPTVQTQIRTERVGQTIWQVEQPMPDSNRPTGFVGPDGTIYVRHVGVIEVLNEQGQRVRSLALKTPNPDYNGIAVAPDGTFWVTAPLGVPDMPILHLSAEGELLGGFGHERLQRPDTIRIGLDGTLHILNYTAVGGGYLTIFAPDGTLLREIDFVAIEPTLGDYPYFSLDQQSNHFVTQFRSTFNTTGVWVFDQTGLPIARQLGAAEIGLLGVKDIAVSPDGQAIYVAFGFEVYRIQRDGKVVGRFGRFQSRSISFPDGRFYDITSIGMMPNGDVVAFDANETYYQVVRIRF